MQMPNLSIKWLLKCMNVAQKQYQVGTSSHFQQYFGNDFSLSMKKRLHHYDLETKQKSMLWQHSGSSQLKKLKLKGKDTAIVILDKVF